jgi:hypothetical protein
MEMHRRSLVLVAVLVLAQTAGEESAEEPATEELEGKAVEQFRGEYERPPTVNLPEPRGGVWGAPPGESGASRHAPRPGPGGALPEGEDVNRLEIGPGDGSD